MNYGKVAVVTLALSMSFASGFGALVNDTFEGEEVGEKRPDGWKISRPKTVVVAEGLKGNPGKVLLIRNDGDPRADRNFSDGRTTLNIQFDYKMMNGEDGNRTASDDMFLYKKGPDAYGAYMDVLADGCFRLYAENGRQVITTLEVDTWYHIEFDLNAEDEITVTVTGGGLNESASDTLCNEVETSDVAELRFKFSGKTRTEQSFAIDNLVVDTKKQ